MTLLDRRPGLRWLLTGLAAALLVSAGSWLGVITATARGGLPERSAAQLLVDVQKARLDGLSGTVVQTADLGLPSLPGIGGGGSSELSSLVSGSHTLRLWYAGPSRVRLALLGSLGESDVIRNGTDLWTWSSATRSATHRTLPAAGPGPRDLASMSPLSPQQAADAALAAISPSTRVRTDGTAVVAGRPAYELLLLPRDARSLVSSVRVAIDGKTRVPLRVQVFAKNLSDPAFQVGFTSFDPATPDASVFGFNPPPGTKVSQRAGLSSLGLSGLEGAGHGTQKAGKPARERAGQPTGSRPRVVGSGWTSVVVTKLPTARAADTNDMLSTLLQAVPQASGSWGSGRVLRGTLFSAIVTDDGRVAIGAVPASMLESALAAR